MGKKRFFRECIIDFLQHSIVEGKRILIIGGNISEEAIRFAPSYSAELFSGKDAFPGRASGGYQNVTYLNKGLLDFEADETYDYIIFYESLNYEGDLYSIFRKLKKIIHRDSKVFVIEINPFILFLLKILSRVGLLVPDFKRNMLHLSDLENLVNIFGFDIVDKGYRFAVPFKIFGLGDVINSILPRVSLLRNFCFGQYIVFRLHPLEAGKQNLSCSVVVPCHNEEGNIADCIARIPNFGAWREIIVVDDGSTDRTKDMVKKIMRGRSDIRLISYEKNCGKGYAVNIGWQEAKGDVFMMLDCDSTTPPEELALFHEAMEYGAEFVNGTRVIYPREKNSIPFFNRLGVTFFAHLISWITQKRISDTFCGTKVFLKKYWNCFQIKEFLWGDWDLFFTAARYRMKMLELPVHYKTRKHGVTKMRPVKHGIILLLKSVEGLRVVK